MQEEKRILKNTVIENGFCTGFAICCVTCGVNAIKLVHNNEGFLEPTIHENLCVNCGLCRQVCY